MPIYYENVELLPCPFCGAEAGLFQSHKNGYTIHCKRCLVKKTQKVLRMGMDWLHDKMIEDWNKRTDKP